MRPSSGPPAGRGFAIGGDAPVEIRLAAGLLVGGSVLFVLGALLRIPEVGSSEGLFLLPLLQLALFIGIGGGLLLGKRLARISGVILALLFALLHLSVALQGLAIWVRVLGGVIAAGLIYAAVLLNTRPALEHTGVRPRR